MKFSMWGNISSPEDGDRQQFYHVGPLKEYSLLGLKTTGWSYSFLGELKGRPSCPESLEMGVGVLV